MTARIIRALENPRVTMLGHVTGRLLLEREPYQVDVAKVIDAAIANGVVVELNANPYRLDMDWRHWRRAAERGLECSINPDAHGTEQLAYVKAGINSARKGWLGREQVDQHARAEGRGGAAREEGGAPMLDVRARGLANIHAAMMTAFVGVFFWAYASLIYHVPYVRLSREVNLLPYFLCVIAGMLLSARDVSRRLAARFHLPDLGGSARMAFRQVALMALLVFTMMFATQDHRISRLFLGTFLVWCWAGLALLNAWVPGRLARFVFRKGHRLPTVFIGRPESFAKLREWIAHKEPLGIHPVGLLSPEPPAAGSGAISVPWLGKPSDLPRVLDEALVGQVIMLELPASDDEAGRIIGACRERGCRLMIHSDIEERYSQPLVPVTVGGVPPLLHAPGGAGARGPVQPHRQAVVRRGARASRRRPGSSRPCAVGWPNAEAPGARAPLPRPGAARQAGEVFCTLKFRSMFASKGDAAAESMQALSEDQQAHLLRSEGSCAAEPGRVPGVPGNVLVGEMSVVWPAPYMPLLDEEFRQQAQGYRIRNLVKPGITGLSQSLGYRGAVLEEEMVRRRVYWDVYYISHWSVWLDLQIAAKTLWQVVVPPATAF